MNFLEDTVVNNPHIDDDTQEALFLRQPMLIYDFIGCISACQDIPDVYSKWLRLTEEDKLTIKKSQVAMDVLRDVQEKEDVLRLKDEEK